MKVSQFTRYTKYKDDLVVYNTYNGGVGVINQKSNPLEYSSVIKAIDEKMKNAKLFEDSFSKNFLNNFCVHDDADEINILSEDHLTRAWDPRNLFFICVINNFCNFKCNYCYEEHDKKEISQMTIDKLFEAIVNYHKNVKLNKIGIEWYGGEPLLSKDILIMFTNRLNKFCNENKVLPVYAITTNGYDLVPNVVDTFIDLGITSFQITIDGNENLHNRLRPLKNGGGTWSRITENLKYMASLRKNFHVMVRVNYTYETLEHYDELLDFMKDNFDNDRFSIFFHGISDWGGNSTDNATVVEDDIKTYIACEMIERTIQKGINITRLNTAFSRYGKVCYASIPNHFVVSSDGKLRKCTFDMPKFDYYNCVGDINSGVIAINRDKSSNFETPKHYNETCLKCDILPVCMNMSCPKTNLYRELKDCTIDRVLIDKVYESKYRLIKSGNYSSTKLVGILY